MGIGLELLGAVLLFLLSWWIGWRVYLHLWLKQKGHTQRCPHCGHYHRTQSTYCPSCGEVMPRWSSRR